MKNPPLLLYRKDIQLLTGKKVKYAQGVIREVWASKKKIQQRWITVADFCHKFELSEETVQARLSLLHAQLT